MLTDFKKWLSSGWATFIMHSIKMLYCYSCASLDSNCHIWTIMFLISSQKDIFLTTQSNLNKTVILFFFIRKIYNHMVYSWKWNSQFQMLFDPCSFHLWIDKQYVGFSNLTFLMRHYKVIQLFWIVTGTITQYIFLSHFNSVYLLISQELVHSSL